MTAPVHFNYRDNRIIDTIAQHYFGLHPPAPPYFKLLARTLLPTVTIEADIKKHTLCLQRLLLHSHPHAVLYSEGYDVKCIVA